MSNIGATWCDEPRCRATRHGVKHSAGAAGCVNSVERQPAASSPGRGSADLWRVRVALLQALADGAPRSRAARDLGITDAQAANYVKDVATSWGIPNAIAHIIAVGFRKGILK